MSDETESHTIRLLREMRKEMREHFDEMEARFDHIDERFDEVNTQIRGVTHMITLLAAHSSTPEDRVTALEDGVPG